MNVKNAKEAADSISYRRGIVTGTDYNGGAVDVIADGVPAQSIPVVYDCGDGSYGPFAFCIGDDVMVRYYNGYPQNVVGFYGNLWPCIPMPSYTMISDDKVYSRSLFQDTGYVRSSLALFGTRYSQIEKRTCAVNYELYINKPCPDMSDKFVILETDVGSDPSRDVNMYYDGTFVYHTYNANPSDVFNGTRSNIIGAFINPYTKTGLLVYQVNTFTNWRPQVSGHVDFDFYLYASTGTHIRICGASCDVTGAVSAVSGECVSYAEGFRCDDEQLGRFMSCTLYKSKADTFTADQFTNTLNAGDRLSNTVLTEYISADGIKNVTETYSTDAAGMITYPDGSAGYPSRLFYKKIR